MRFYDLEPDGKNGSHYLCCNGERIARYSSLAAAEEARESFMMGQLAPYREIDGTFEHVRR